MNALLEAAIAWKDADEYAQAFRDALRKDDLDLDTYCRLNVRCCQVYVNLVLPAKRALHLAIEQAEDEEEQNE